MSYTALYRKFRPQNFHEVSGQEAIVTTLKNQLNADRIGHAYLFCGTRGTGKTTIAKILARAVNCEHPGPDGPCNECESCRSILDGRSTNVIEIDAASNNGVDNIREIRENVAYHPTEGKYKVYIIDEVHMLSTGAFNALLKTLEEPPEYVIFILATTEAHKIPVTILSRCQRYDFKRISIDEITRHLQGLLEQEGVEAEEKAVRYLARTADGSMRDALSLLDRCISFYLGEALTFDKVLGVLGTVDTEVFGTMLQSILADDAAGAIGQLETLVHQGKEMGRFAADFTWYLRNLLLLKSASGMESVLDLSSEAIDSLKAMEIDTSTVMRYIRILSELSSDLKYSTQKRIVTEMALIRLCKPEMQADDTSIKERIRKLEDAVAAYEEKLAEMQSAKVFLPPSGHGISNRNDAEVSPAAKTEQKPAIAAPEDLKKIRREWLQIIGALSPMFRQMMGGSVPKYNAEHADGILYIYADAMAVDYCENYPAELEELHQRIRELTGKDVEIQFRKKNERDSSAIQEIPVEEILKEKINFEIEVEDD